MDIGKGKGDVEQIVIKLAAAIIDRSNFVCYICVRPSIDIQGVGEKLYLIKTQTIH